MVRFNHVAYAEFTTHYSQGAEMRFAALTFATVIAFASPGFAADVKIILWNAKELFDEQTVTDRKMDLKKFATDQKPDILLIDEVCSLAVVKKVKEVMGLDGYHVVCSDFNQRDDQRHGSFEVGIISKFKIDKAVEYDVTPDNKKYGRGDEPNERQLTADSLLKIGLDKATPGRGFLWARIDALKLTICLAHLKSSSRGDDRENAMKREYVAAAMALSVVEDKKQFPTYAYIVAADVNVGATDAKKNGDDLDVDNVEGSGDKYDETHALLSKGLVHGLKMKNLTKDVGETYDSNRFPGTGPIDNIYVHGANINRFGAGKKSSKTYGSDHFAVWTMLETQ